MSSPPDQAGRALAHVLGWRCVCLWRRRIAHVYDHSPSKARLQAVVETVTALVARTTGAPLHIGDDLACFIAQNRLHYLR
jgi:hypothetical protein